MLILEFVLILIFLIVIHEFGHFLACKLVKVEVEEFGIGLPPRAATLFRWGETQFTLNWLPLGGFVRPKGENDPNVPGGLSSAPAWARVFVLSAGPAMNLLLAVLLYGWLTISPGMPDTSRSDEVLVAMVAPGSPAESSGLRSGDELVQIAGQVIDSSDQAHTVIYANLGKPLDFIIRRAGSDLTLTITPRAEPPPGEGAVGILMDMPRAPAPWHQVLPLGLEATYEHSKALLTMLGRLVTRQTTAEEGEVVGLPGMYSMYSSIRQSEALGAGNYGTLGFVIQLTVSLGLLNLLPIPALDGGRILLTLPELVLRRRVPQEAENWLNGVGFILLIGLLLFINFRDLFRLVGQ